LWLQGYADQSERLVEDVVRQAVESKDVLSLCQVLVQAACPVSLFVGDLAALERYVAMLLDQSARQALEFWRIYGRCFHAVLQIRRGRHDEGIASLTAALHELRQIHYGVLYTMFMAEYAAALGRTARAEEGLSAIDATLARCEQYDERWYFPELLRVRGEIVLRTGQPDAAKEAEKSFREALDWSSRQQTSAWQLRAAISLTEFHRASNRKDETGRLLSSVHATFAEGFDTADLRKAKGLLATA
jgi:predicted ATPase